VGKRKKKKTHVSQLSLRRCGGRGKESKPSKLRKGLVKRRKEKTKKTEEGEKKIIFFSFP